MKTYVVERPYRGVATYLVKAESAKEALEKVNAGHSDVENLDMQIRNWVGKARNARIDSKEQ